MANNKSAKKRIKTSYRKKLENAPYRSLVKTFIKKYFFALALYKTNPNDETHTIVQKSLSLAYSKIDRAKNKNLLVRNSAARKKSRLYKALSRVDSF
jgi:small subunit ribosomal protein S20